MRRIAISLTVSVSVALLVSPAVAQSSRLAAMKTCDTEAKSRQLTGDGRKAFMSKCLIAGSSNSQQLTPQQQQQLTLQQQRARVCKLQASNSTLTASDRKAFMAKCLKGG